VAAAAALHEERYAWESGVAQVRQLVEALVPSTVTP
jgi:hypothetical protein